MFSYPFHCKATKGSKRSMAALRVSDGRAGYQKEKRGRGPALLFWLDWRA